MAGNNYFSKYKSDRQGKGDTGEDAATVVKSDSRIGQDNTQEPFSVFTRIQKRIIVLIAALTTLLPPLTGSTYYPVIPTMAHDLNVSVSDIGYTITAYLLVQGIAPSFIGNLSDETGRRPALIVAFIVYITSCIGAAFKTNYAVLLVMRCIQSAGSSGTIAMSLATVSDIVTSAERGSYTSYVQMGWMVGPAIGPIIGGLLSRYLGWRSIFWFLAIFGTTVFVALLFFMPETSRNIVGNGSIPAPTWNRPLVDYFRRTGNQPCRNAEKAVLDSQPPQQNKTRKSLLARISPWSSLKLFGQKETCLLLLYSGTIYASSYVIVSTMPTQLQKHYGLTTVQISLCYLATGFGTILSVLATGRLLDWNFRRHARRLGLNISKNEQQDLTNFPIELVRLQITLPLLILASFSLLTYGWTLQARIHLSVPLIFLFLQSFGSASAFSGLNNLLMDLNRERAGTASAAMNLSRCWMGAGGVALAGVIGEKGGIGWLSVTVVGVWVLLCPMVVVVLRCGARWRAMK